MAVAKSYARCDIMGEPFYNQDSNKWYVEIKLGSGKLKIVRWYSDAEYARMYGEPVTPVAESPRSVRKVLGFNEGYITIFRGDQDANNEWFRKSNARYARNWGWYIVSTEQVPEQLPFGIEAVKLHWDEIGLDNGELKPEHIVKQIVEDILYGDETSGQHIGQIGERLDLTLTVQRTFVFDGAYGKSTMHIMKDDRGNEFIWTTGAKTLVVGETYTMRATVKDHKIYKGVNQTILTRCAIAKK